jgi:hypothetical protein
MPTYVAVAPRLPSPPKEYTQTAFEQFNNALRLYFNQLDEGIRETAASTESQAQVWFLG